MLYIVGALFVPAVRLPQLPVLVLVGIPLMAHVGEHQVKAHVNDVPNPAIVTIVPMMAVVGMRRAIQLHIADKRYFRKG